MATLEKIRNKAGLLVVVVGLALFAFIIGDFLRSGSTFFQQSKEKIAIVDGQSINARDFQQRVDEELERYKSQKRGVSVTEEEQAQIRQQIFDQMVSQILLDKESEKVGFTVSKEELKDMIIGDNISPMIRQMQDFINPQTGAFDKNMLLQFLQMIESDNLESYPAEARPQIAKAKEFWLTFEQTLKQQQLQSKFTTLLAMAVVPNSLDVKANHEDNRISVDFDYVSQAYTTIADDKVTVSDAELKKLYEERKENCKQEAGKVVSYIAVPVVPSKDDYRAIEKQLSELKESFLTSTDVADIVNENSDVSYLDAYLSDSQLEPTQKIFVEKANIGDVDGPVLIDQSYRMFKLVEKIQAPDSVRWNQLMLPAGADEARMIAFTDSLVGLIKGGKPFAEVAQEASNGQTNGDMGWQTEATLVRGVDVKFKNTVFNATVNDVFVTKSNLGTHIVQVVEKTKPVTKYKLATIQVAVTPSTQTRDNLYGNLAQYISKNTALESFKSSATEAGYECLSEVNLNPNQPTLSSISSSRQVIRWAFEHSKGTVSDIFDCQSHLVVAAVEGSLKEGFCPQSVVADALKRELMNKKKADMIIADLKAKKLTSLDQYAGAMGTMPQSIKFVTFATSRITGLGQEPIINAIAPLAEVGKATEPLAGNTAVYVLNVTDKRAGDEKLDMAAGRLAMQSQGYYRMFQAAQILKEKAKIEDNRIRFY